MPAPTEAEVRTQIGNAIKLVHECFLKASSASPNFVGLYDTLIQSLETDLAGEAAAGAQAFRNAIAAALATGRRMVDPLLVAYARARDFPETDPFLILDRLYQDYIDRSQTVASRVFTFGTVAAAGGNSGNGTVNRLTKDENNFDIENAWPDAWTAECVQDEHSFAVKHEEAFEVRGGDLSVDGLEQLGSGIVVPRVTALSGRAAQAFLQNPSFDLFDGTAAAPTAISGWTVNGSIANLQIDQGNVYRGFDGDGGTPGALMFETNEKVVQALSVRRAQFNPRVPYYCQIAFNRAVGSSDGTLTLRFGAKSAAVALAAQAGWNVLRITLDDDCWHKNFNEQAFNVEVELSARTTGTLLVDDIVIGPFTRVGGTWIAIVGGSTPFLRRDKFTWTDTATDSILQRWLWRIYGSYLPHTTGAPTWAEP
jgi:hypothetical protein